MDRSSKRSLMVFRYNLRIHDNQVLKSLMRQSGSLDCVYVLEPEWFETSEGQLPDRHGYRARMGKYRKRFLLQALQDLKQQLEKRGSTLLLVQGRFMPTVASLIESSSYEQVGLVEHPGFFESRQQQQLQTRFAKVQWLLGDDFTLFTRDSLPFDLQDLPATFSRFRKQVEQQLPALPKDVIGALPPGSAIAKGLEPESDRLWNALMTEPWYREDAQDESSRLMTGGETAALEHVNQYIHLSGAIRHYKETRNQLQGWDFSSKLSPWLAQGCVSPRMVWHEVLRHEQRYGRNDSTGWLLFELLWREYFQWMAMRYGASLFTLRGIKNVNPLLTYYPEAFVAWREGNTPAPFVNAFMRQLKATGWMSNRGRQIVASYLVNDMGVDWRFGAAWFEEALIDYDCAANWGNWQYLAGVGADPRGRRRFNIDKQQEQYDPEGDFIKQWAGDNNDWHYAGFF